MPYPTITTIYLTFFHQDNPSVSPRVRPGRRYTVITMLRANILITSSLQANENLGSVEVATFISLALYGLSLSQGYTFFRRSEKDAASLKIFVSGCTCFCIKGVLRTVRLAHSCRLADQDLLHLTQYHDQTLQDTRNLSLIRSGANNILRYNNESQASRAKFIPVIEHSACGDFNYFDGAGITTRISGMKCYHNN